MKNYAEEIFSDKNNIVYSDGAFLVNNNGFNSVKCSRLKLVLSEWNSSVNNNGFSSDIEEMLINGDMLKAFTVFINRNYNIGISIC